MNSPAISETNCTDNNLLMDFTVIFFIINNIQGKISIVYNAYGYGGAGKKKFAPLIDELRRWRLLLDNDFTKHKLQIKSQVITSQR
jgi:hypothetical protein